jgi:hypothetical protein
LNELQQSLYKQCLEYTLSEIYMVWGKLYVKLVSPEQEVVTHQVSLVAILTGSKADLSYLPLSYQNGKALAVSIPSAYLY